MKIPSVSLIAAALSVASAPLSHAVIAMGLSSNSLIGFNTDAPAIITSTTLITGLTAGDVIVDIDYRPSDGNLYASAGSGRLYTVNTGTGSATLNTSSSVGIVQDTDFNPVADRLRIFSEGNANYRITPGTGVKSSDGVLSYALDDINSLQYPSLVGAAYSNSFAGAATTVLYSLDSELNTLVKHEGGPEFSSLRTVGELTVGGFLMLDIGTNVGFDIYSSGGTDTAFLSNGNQLYRLDLATGDTDILADIGGSLAGRPSITSIALVPEPGSLLLGALPIAMMAFRRRRI